MWHSHLILAKLNFQANMNLEAKAPDLIIVDYDGNEELQVERKLSAQKIWSKKNTLLWSYKERKNQPNSAQNQRPLLMKFWVSNNEKKTPISKIDPRFRFIMKYIHINSLPKLLSHQCPITWWLRALLAFIFCQDWVWKVLSSTTMISQTLFIFFNDSLGSINRLQFTSLPDASIQPRENLYLEKPNRNHKCYGAEKLNTLSVL